MCVGNDLVASCVFQASDDLNGDVEAPRERHVPVRIFFFRVLVYCARCFVPKLRITIYEA